MKKQYTKKQIQEAISYWKKQLRAGNYKKLDESRYDTNPSYEQASIHANYVSSIATQLMHLTKSKAQQDAYNKIAVFATNYVKYSDNDAENIVYCFLPVVEKKIIEQRPFDNKFNFKNYALLAKLVMDEIVKCQATTQREFDMQMDRLESSL